MTWTERDDKESVCDGDLGAVGDDESVARLLLVQNPPSGWRPFKRQDFLPAEGGEIDNVCGQADGCSVDRADDLDAAELRKRSEKFAADSQAAAEARKPQKIMRTGGGAIAANVGSLRKIKLRGKPDRQIVFVYDDPMQGNIQHAVIRVQTSVPEEEFTLVIDEISKTFGENVCKGANDG